MNGHSLRLGSAVLTVALLAGCATMQGGATGAIGDEEIAQDVGSRLREDSITKNHPFGVDVVSGVVYLQSSATLGENVKVRAASIAAGAEGVRNVVFGDAGLSTAPAQRIPAAAPARYQPAQKVPPKAEAPAVSKKPATAPAVRSSTGGADDPFAPVPMK